jgi:predicted acetyltransferase
LQGAIIERKGKAEGYLVFTLARQPGKLRLNMVIQDWACTTHDAAEALMAQIYGQRSVVEDAALQLAPSDSLVRHFVHDQNVPVTECMLWMLRIVRAQEALAARGWPEIRCEAAFSLIDEQIPENRGHWRLRVQDGKAEVERTRRAEIGLHIRGLAALYSGFQTPAGLRKMGLLQGEDKHDGALVAMFAGPAPWMPDYF